MNLRKIRLDLISKRQKKIYFQKRELSSQTLGKNQSSDLGIDEKYATNGGIIEGIWIFHRHGDRTPSSPLVAEHLIEKEAAFWRTKLPDSSIVENVSSRFPKRSHSKRNVDYLDGKREPYGFLTRVGTSQMFNAGRKFASRYKHLGRKTKSLLNDDTNRNALLNQWDITAYSTNYLRTITSAQFFLEGLLHSKDPPPTNKLSSTQIIDLEDSMSIDPITYVNVRSREVDTLNAFDKNPEKMLSLVSDVVSTPTFQSRDALALPLATLLANFLPGLATNKKNLFGGPSGINWIHATDHFVCRAAHGLKLTSFEGDLQSRDSPDDITHTNLNNIMKNTEIFWNSRHEEQMQALAFPTKAHLAWRYQQWFTHSPLLSAIVVPPLTEVERDIRATPNLGSNDKYPLKIYSCHDVTILSLLYGLGATTVIQNERYWPPYATTLVFELVKLTETDEYVIRVLLNGKPVQNQMNRLMRMDDFSQLIQNLQLAGDLDDDNIDTSAMERDMASWTG